MRQNLINHIAFIVDRSTSIRDYHLVDSIINVFDNQIKWLAKRSEELSQETRVSVYLFGSDIECVVYDMDVLRLPSLKELYKVEGATKLIDATIQAIDDLSETPQKYGDHAFLFYVLTDGEENNSRNLPYTLANRIAILPDNWTLAAYVPNQRGRNEATSAGFPTNNIAIWSVGKAGLEEVGRGLRDTTETYFQARATGVRGTKSLFKLDLKNLSKSKITQTLNKLNPRTYVTLPVRHAHDGMEIRDFVYGQSKTPYVKGSAYYELIKTEKVQPGKKILVRDRSNGNVYGGQEARQLLGLPDTHVTLNPVDTGNYDVFIQSTSFNRHVNANTEVIVLAV
jgi:hypothetical protein